MAFSDYKTISEVQAEFKIKYQEDNFVLISEYKPSAAFIEDLKFNQENLDVFSSEASRCEMIIFPVLREIYKDYYKKTSFWVQKTISYNDNLNGTPDYVVSKRSDLGKTMLEFPILIIIEAKKNDFDQGWAQCLSGLVAAEFINDNLQMEIFGIVTDGKLWEFGKLMDKKFTKNIYSFTVAELTNLFGALKFVFGEATKMV